jgi:hypothetical protein
MALSRISDGGQSGSSQTYDERLMGVVMRHSIGAGVIFLTASLALAIPPASAQAVKGIVTDSATGKPIAGVAVTIVGTDLRSTTGADGYYRIAPLSAGERVVRAELTGYTPVQHTVVVADTGSVTSDFVLSTSKTPRLLGSARNKLALTLTLTLPDADQPPHGRDQFR